MVLSTVFTYAPVLGTAISGGFRIIIITVVVAALAAFFAPVSDTEGGDGE
jgi:uncharacterized membrane protein YccC